MLPRGLDRWLPFLAGGVTFGVAMGFAWSPHGTYTTDTSATILPAWMIGHHGQLAIPLHYVGPSAVSELVLRHGDIYSNRPLGMILAYVPGQLPFGSPSLWGDAIMTSIMAALTVMAVVKLWGIRPALLVAGASPLLSVVGRTLWPETVCIPVLLLMLLVLRSQRRIWLLLPMVTFMTMCRPPFGLLALLVAAVMIGRKRDVAWPAVGFGLGIATLFVYSHVVFDQWSLAGGYPVPHTVIWHSLWIGLFSPARGLLVWTPWLLFVRLRRDRWTLVLFVAAAYTVATWLAFDAWGGSGFVGYRYAVPLVVLAATSVRRPSGRIWRLAFYASVVWSVSVTIVTEVVHLSGFLRRNENLFGLPWGKTLAIAAGVAVIAVLGTQLTRSRAEHAAFRVATSTDRAPASP